MKKVKKKKTKFFKIILFLIVLIIIGISIKLLLEVKTKNIVILNNNYYTDEQIIEKANLENYPNFILLNTKSIKNKLKKLDLIEDVKVIKRWGFILKIKVKEKRILYYIRSKEEYMTSDNNSYKLDDQIGYPTLINYVPEKIEEAFVKGLSKVDESVIRQISEIEYSKTDYDDKRFLLYMNDSKRVYITVSKVEVLNKYVDIVKKIGNKKGTLYLDSGNYFEIKK